MRINISEQCKISIILLTCSRERLRCIERLGIEPLTKINVGQIELNVIGIRICAEGILQVTNRFIVQMVPSQQDPDSGLGAVVICAYLIKLSDGLFCLVPLTKLQIGFGKQIKVLRLARIFFNLGGEFRHVKLSALLSS